MTLTPEILSDLKEFKNDYKSLHDHYVKLLEDLKDTDSFSEYHKVQNKLSGLFSMHKNGEIPEKVLTEDRDINKVDQDPWANFR